MEVEKVETEVPASSGNKGKLEDWPGWKNGIRKIVKKARGRQMALKKLRKQFLKLYKTRPEVRQHQGKEFKKLFTKKVNT